MLNKTDPSDSELAPNAHTSETAFTRPQVRGKFLFVGKEKFWVRGVTYGTFRPDESGANYPSSDVVERDFAAIKSAGLNALRLYTVPPALAARLGRRSRFAGDDWVALGAAHCLPR